MPNPDLSVRICQLMRLLMLKSVDNCLQLIVKLGLDGNCHPFFNIFNLFLISSVIKMLEIFVDFGTLFQLLLDLWFFRFNFLFWFNQRQGPHKSRFHTVLLITLFKDKLFIADLHYIFQRRPNLSLNFTHVFQIGQLLCETVCGRSS